MFIVAGGASASQTRAHIMSVIKEKGFKVDIADMSSKIGLLAIQGPARFEKSLFIYFFFPVSTFFL